MLIHCMCSESNPDTLCVQWERCWSAVSAVGATLFPLTRFGCTFNSLDFRLFIKQDRKSGFMGSYPTVWFSIGWPHGDVLPLLFMAEHFESLLTILWMSVCSREMKMITEHFVRFVEAVWRLTAATQHIRRHGGLFTWVKCSGDHHWFYTEASVLSRFHIDRRIMTTLLHCVFNDCVSILSRVMGWNPAAEIKKLTEPDHQMVYLADRGVTAVSKVIGNQTVAADSNSSCNNDSHSLLNELQHLPSS